MRPDDANIVGNVHGGTILKMIEEAGCIISTRHCNSQNGVSSSSWYPLVLQLNIGTTIFFIKCDVFCAFLEQMSMVKM